MDAADRKAERQRIEEEAASLVVRRHADGAAREGADAAMIRWAAQSPAHGVALAQAQLAWAAAERLRAVTPAEVAATGHLAQAGRRPSRRLVLGGGLAAAIAGGTLALDRLLAGERFRTAIGEQRRITLADGTALHLNTDTVLDLDTRADGTVATLVRGEVLFDLAAAARPLTVLAGTATLQAVRTAFDVSMRGTLAELVVARGLVTILAQGRGRRVAAGTGAAIERGAVAIAALLPGQVDQRLAWRRGLIDLDGQSLAQAVDEFNRYLTHPIIVADPSLAALRLGGTFATNESDAFVDAVQRSFPIAAVRSADGSVLLVPTSGAGPATSLPKPTG